MFSILRILNVTGLGGGLVSAVVFDDRLTGPWRLALFAALAVLDLLLIIWITRTPDNSASDSTDVTPAQPRQTGPVPAAANLAPAADVIGEAEPVRRAA